MTGGDIVHLAVSNGMCLLAIGSVFALRRGNSGSKEGCGYKGAYSSVHEIPPHISVDGHHQTLA
jgi:hypothetical protein